MEAFAVVLATLGGIAAVVGFLYLVLLGKGMSR